MRTTGRVSKLRKDGGRFIVELELDHPQGLDGLTDCLLDISIEKHRQRRSLNANALLWQCIGELAATMRADKWDIYLLMLKRYGRYTYVCIRPQALEMLKRQWRETEVIGEIDINGQKATQVLCYYGSSTYDTKDFSVLLDGVISEMKELGIPTPMPMEVKKSLEAWEKKNSMEGS